MRVDFTSNETKSTRWGIASSLFCWHNVEQHCVCVCVSIWEWCLTFISLIYPDSSDVFPFWRLSYSLGIQTCLVPCGQEVRLFGGFRWATTHSVSLNPVVRKSISDACLLETLTLICNWWSTNLMEPQNRNVKEKFLISVMTEQSWLTLSLYLCKKKIKINHLYRPAQTWVSYYQENCWTQCHISMTLRP